MIHRHSNDSYIFLSNSTKPDTTACEGSSSDIHGVQHEIVHDLVDPLQILIHIFLYRLTVVQISRHSYDTIISADTSTTSRP